MPRILPTALATLVVWAAQVLAVAPESLAPFVEHLEPPGVARGQTMRLTLVGERIDRAVGLWTSLPPGKLRVVSVVSTTLERSVLEVETAADCPVGLYGLRLATEDGLSNLHLFTVDDLPPLEKLADPQAEFPVAVTGQLRTGDLERHRLRVAAGQRLTFDVVASRLGNDADPLITILDARGRRLAQHDNSPGIFFDTCFAHTFAEAGVVTVEVRDARFQGTPHWRYLLRIGDFPAARTSLPSAIQPGVPTTLNLPEVGGAGFPWTPPAELPLGMAFHGVRRPSDRASAWIPLLASPLPNVIEQEPNNASDQASVVPAIPALLHGVLDSPEDRDYFAFDLKKGDRLVFKAETKSLQSAADVELALFDGTGRELQRADDVSLPGGALDEASLNFNVGQDGKFLLRVRDVTRAGGNDFVYRVEVQRAAPRVQLSAETSAFTIPLDSYQVLPLSVTRFDYPGAITLHLQDAPAGLSLEPATIAAGANSIVCALRASATTPQGVHRFSIIARLADGDAPQEFAVTVQPLVDRQYINVDLIKHALRDNQRYLPPSVRTQLALLVTPPSPFAMDPADVAVVLPRYQLAELPLAPLRQPGFAGPIAFSAWSGGQLGEETQGRKQVFYRFPSLAAEQPQGIGTIHSRSQANEGQERVDLFATATIGSRRVTLNRSIQLSIKPAVEIALEPPQLTLAPGKSTKVKVLAKRLPSFSGPLMVAVNPPTGVTLPSSLMIAEGQMGTEIEVQLAADAKPRRERIRFAATATVGAFQEEPRPAELDLEIKLEAPSSTGN